MAIKIQERLTPGQIIATSPANLRLLPEHVSRHIFIAGGSGKGKSKLIELICRQLINNGSGFTFVDPHGDTIDALLSFLAIGQIPAERVHLLRPGPDCCFSFDPFAGLTGGPTLSYEARL